jgi:glutamate racemase
LTGKQKIGIFDSGVGGLSVLRQLTGLIPRHSIVYVADQAHVPYGRRPLEEVQAFCFEITRWLFAQGCGEIIVACNTASAAALHELRKAYPNIPFVGMEPAVKPAAEQTHTGVVGVIATPATFQGALYASVVERFASGVTVLEDTCPGLVEQIEAGDLEGAETRRVLEKAILPMLEKGIDTIVMGCTHFPFVIPLIQQITGPNVRVIDPAPAVARQAVRVLPDALQHPGGNRSIHLYTTGDPAGLENLARNAIREAYSVHTLAWDADNHLALS